MQRCIPPRTYCLSAFAYAHPCRSGHCKKLAPVWEEVGKVFAVRCHLHSSNVWIEASKFAVGCQPFPLHEHS